MKSLIATLSLTTAIIIAGPYGYAHAADLLYIAPTPAGITEAQPMTLGSLIASRIQNSDAEDASKFKTWLASSDVTGLDMSKGYTAFVVTDSSFDPAAHPIEHYIVNDRVGLPAVDGKHFQLTSANGDTLEVGRLMGSFQVDGMRVNSVIKNPEGTIYLIGEPVSAFNL
jgi:hypothetical protein